MLFVHPGVKLDRERDGRLKVAMAGEILPDESRPIRDALLGTGLSRKKKKVRAPDISGGDDNCLACSSTGSFGRSRSTAIACVMRPVFGSRTSFRTIVRVT